MKISSRDETDKFMYAASFLLNDEVVAIPTETVYGLAGNAFSETAVRRIFEAKGRPQDNPLIVHIAEFPEIYELVKEVPKSAEMLAERFWPGPLTMILPRSDEIPDCVTAGMDTVAVRCPAHFAANELIRVAGVPLAAPSANLSGKPSPTKAEHVYHDLKGRIPLVIDGGECREGVESTVISLASDVPHLLRPGNVTLPQLREVLGEVEVDPAVLKPLPKGAKVLSPGMKYKHYSPDADVVLVKGSLPDFVGFVNANQSESTYAMVFDGEQKGIEVPSFTYGNKKDPRSLSNRLFDVLRQLDTVGAKRCYVRCPEENEEDLAVMNRLLRAAAFQIITV